MISTWRKLYSLFDILQLEKIVQEQPKNLHSIKTLEGERERGKNSLQGIFS